MGLVEKVKEAYNGAKNTHINIGSKKYNNPEEKTYITIGITPKVEITGEEEINANYHTIGLLGAKNEVKDKTKLNGNLTSIAGFIGGNEVSNNSEAKNLTTTGIIGYNKISDNSEAEKLISIAGFIGGNVVSNNSEAKNLTTTGIIGYNKISDSSEAEKLTSAGMIVYNRVK